MANTQGINHLGLTVENLDESLAFFVDCLGFEASGRDDSYPRCAVSDGSCRLTLWQVDQYSPVTAFNRRNNIGLHHLALQVESEDKLNELSQKANNHPNVTIEFTPELLGAGPRKHMMLLEPGGIRIELIWQGE